MEELCDYQRCGPHPRQDTTMLTTRLSHSLHRAYCTYLVGDST